MSLLTTAEAARPKKKWVLERSGGPETLPLSLTLWNRQQCVDFLKCNKRSIQKIEKLPGYPRARLIGSGRWYAQEIIDWAARQPAADQIARDLPTITGLVPIKLEYGPGVYFLCLNQKVIYVGQSVTLLNRLVRHQRTRRFDSVHFLPCRDNKEMNRLEAKYIKELRPPLNVSQKPSLSSFVAST